MKHFAIADVHGCYETAMKLLSILPIETGDKIVFLGDYIDRGPDSVKMLQFIEKNIGGSYKGGTLVFLKGNHEDIYENQMSLGVMDIWMSNGGRQTIQSFQKEKKSFLKYLPLICDLPVYHETGKYIFVHAGINKYISNSDVEDFLWSRYSINETKKIVISGHNIVKKEEINSSIANKKNIIMIDNGAFLTNEKSPNYGSLTAYCPEEEKTWFVDQPKYF